MPSRHPEHLPSFSYVGPHRYHLRFCTDAKRQVFTSDAPVDLARSQILRSSREQHFAVIAYCFMPDHLHLLIEGETETSDCKRFIARTKQYSGYQHAAKFKERLWQRYGFERVLREDETTAIVARYILENPIRAGLVTRVEDYPFVGSFTYTLTQLLDSL
jgi:putative transposase